MTAYRTALVWLLRASALAIIGLAAWNFAEMRQAVEAAAAYDQVEAAGLQGSVFSYFIPAGAIALLCLTLAEILALLLKQRSS